jgi:hypothetical protein
MDLAWLKKKPVLDESTSEPRSVSEPRAFVLSAAVPVLVFTVLVFVLLSPNRPANDFCSLWAAARIAGPGIYDAPQGEAIQRTGCPLVKSNRYIRPPFYALLLWPLGQLPFQTANTLWFVMNLAAILAFVRLWGFRPGAYIACAFFLPLWFSFAIEQDVPLMLVAVSAGARLVQQKKELSGGASLALCAVKPHLFLFIPVVLLARKQYRVLAGMLASGGILYLLSSALLGLNWPLAFFAAATENEATIHPRLLGLAGLLSRFGAPAWILAIAAIAGAVIVYRYAKAAAWLPSIAFATAVGVTFAPHALVYDASLLLPLLLMHFPPAAVVAVGAALYTLLTPAAIVSEVTSLALLLAPMVHRRSQPRS